MITDEALAPLVNEKALIHEAKNDPAAFEAVYEIYFARIYNYVRYRVWDAGAADDLTSQIFETVLTKLHTFNPERGAFSAWLFAVARNTVNYSLRRQRIRRWLSLESFYDLASTGPNVDETIIENEAKQQLLTAVKQLSGRERELIALKFAAGLTNREISSLMGLKESHVAVILHRAIKRLRLHMDIEEVQK
jgi:RNA polymerase sigma-70 factor, ECF subfamily